MGVHRVRAAAVSAAALTAALAAASSLSGCSTARTGVAASSPTTSAPGATTPPAAVSSPTPAAPPTPASRTEKWTALQAGDCLAGPPPSDPAVVMVTVVDCAGPHSAETFLRAAIPVNTAIAGPADAQCADGFTAYTGTTLQNSGFSITYLIDSDQDRTSNNPYPSTVICLLQDAQGRPLNGSARR